MPAGSRFFLLATLLLAVPSGCKQGQSWFAPGGSQAQVQQLQQQQMALAQQQQNLQASAQAMNRVNEEKERQLAAARQDVQRLEAHVAALSTRLKDTAAEVVRERSEKQSLDKRYQELLAANRRTGSVSITANSSHKVDLAAVEIRGVDVRRDGDVIRVTLPSSQLFAPGSTQLSTGANSLLDMVGTELARAYPRQLIGVEAHTEAGAPPGGQDPHQLTTLRALAVYQHLVRRGSLRSEQLHVTGHGGAHPVYSNATPAGREANQRIELVVYPETVGTPGS